MRRASIVLVPFLLVSLCRADDSDADLPKKRAAALEKGIAWLKKQQAADGSFDDAYQPFQGLGDHLKQGTTALAALALLKSGVAPDDPCIKKAFDCMAALPLQRTYSVGCLLMALEARINWAPPDVGEGTVERGGAGKAGQGDLELAKKCVRYLTFNQWKHGWAYPMGADGFNEDLSNTQYALLGLEAAERLGLEVPRESYERAQELFVANQEKDGPEVDVFPVPGADLSYKELKKIEKETLDKIKKVEGAFKGKKAGDTNAAGHTEDDEKRQAEGEAAKKVFKTVDSKERMKARGWAYGYNRTANAGGKNLNLNVTGSMTTAGLACLFICKAHLDGTPNYDKLKGPIDKALRDGAAWIAKNFTVTKNPEGGLHHLYYLYGLERAGVLLLVPRFGEHDWYREGTKLLLESQTSDGNWDSGGNGSIGPMADTCFAMLFLARGTSPMIRIPTRTATGPGSNDAPPKGK
ncbi:MAG TPA: hypothetical protein VFF73_38710 [Planctomycetota bacterium]|nr:hypothetical protein [Planctomycetota bacterium]